MVYAFTFLLSKEQFIVAKLLIIREMSSPGLPDWLACEEHKPLAGVGDGSVDSAAGAAALLAHVACVPSEAR